MTTPCPGRLALCGHPCGCEGRNPSHRPQPWRRPVFLAADLPPAPDDDTDQEDQQP